MVASCQQGMSRVLEIQRERERETHEAVTLMSLRIKSMAVRILNVHGLKLGAQDKPRTRLNPLVTAVFIHFWCLVMHSVHERGWVEDFL